MQITVSRNTLGRLIGYLLLAAATLLFSYVITAWLFWQLNPGDWPWGARLVALLLVGLTWAARHVSVTPDEDTQ